jgi:hypothetical protein
VDKDFCTYLLVKWLTLLLMLFLIRSEMKTFTLGSYSDKYATYVLRRSVCLWPGEVAR